MKEQGSWPIIANGTMVSLLLLLVVGNQVISTIEGKSFHIESASAKYPCSTCTTGFTISNIERQCTGGVWEDEDDKSDKSFMNDEAQTNHHDIKSKSWLSIMQRKWKGDGNDIELPTISNVGRNEEEHPMRTDEWLIRLKLSPFMPRHQKPFERRLFPTKNEWKDIDNDVNRFSDDHSIYQVMKFAKNGYVLVMERINDRGEESSRMTRIGKWHMDTSGLSWQIPILLPQTDYKGFEENGQAKSLSTKRTVLHYHADLHLSKFQNRPRMIRGRVTRDRFSDGTMSLPWGQVLHRRSLFRPVLATFTAEGIGEDTISLVYKDRGFALNKGDSTIHK